MISWTTNLKNLGLRTHDYLLKAAKHVDIIINPNDLQRIREDSAVVCQKTNEYFAVRVMYVGNNKGVRMAFLGEVCLTTTKDVKLEEPIVIYFHKTEDKDFNSNGIIYFKTVENINHYHVFDIISRIVDVHCYGKQNM